MAKKKNDTIGYDNLEQQIGDLGNASSNPFEGQKLQHINSSHQLDSKDQDSLNAFIERSNRAKGRIIGSEANELTTDPYQNSIKGGWIPIDKSTMGKRSGFYPESWQFRVRPAEVQAVKNWSLINDEDTNNPEQLYVINQVFNEIVKSCVSITTPAGNLNWSNINSWDRYWFVQTVRDYTFENKSKVTFQENCDNCGEELTFYVEADKLQFDFPDDEVIENHWNAEDRCWEIDPTDYDVQGPAIKLYVPTLGKDDIILQWSYAQAQNGKKIDEVFLKFLPWMLAKAPKDLKLADTMIRECERQYKKWDIEMFSLMEEIVRNISVTPQEVVTTICPNCGMEVRSTVKFQHGIKSLFTMESRHKKFGTK